MIFGVIESPPSTLIGHQKIQGLLAQQN